MKKKYFSVALFSALLLSTPVFTGCADYDDDISNLQSQIDGMKSSVATSDALNALQEALDATKEDLNTVISGKADAQAVKDLQAKVEELTKLIGSSESGEGEEIKGLTEQIQELIKDVNEIKGDVQENYDALLVQKDELEKKIDELNAKIEKAASESASADELEALQKELDTHVAEWNKISADVNEAVEWVKNNGESLAKLTSQITNINEIINVIINSGTPTITDNKVLAAIAALPANTEKLQALDKAINEAATGALARLTEIESWKGTITASLIENGYSDMSAAIDDLAAIKAALAAGTDPENPTILDRLQSLESLKALATQIQSIVFVPTSANDPYSIISEKLSVLTPGTGNYKVIGVKNDNTISFRVTPASAVKDFTKNYKLEFDGTQVRSTVTGLEVSEEPETDETTGIVTYKILTAPTIEAGYSGWAVCARLTAIAEDNDGNPVNTNGTDLVSNYFVIKNSETKIKDVTINTASAQSIEYKYNDNENSKLDLNSLVSFSLVDESNATINAVDTKKLLEDFGLTPEYVFTEVIPSGQEAIFSITDGIISPKKEGNTEIGKSATIKLNVKLFGNTYTESSFATVDIVARTVNEDLNDGNVWAPATKFIWKSTAQSYALPQSISDEAILASNLTPSEFADLTGTSTCSDPTYDNKVVLVKGNNTNAWSIFVAAGTVIPEEGLTLTWKATNADQTEAQSYTFNLKIAGTDMTMLGDKANVTFSPDANKLNQNGVATLRITNSGSALKSTFEMSEMFTNYSDVVTAASSVGANITYTLLDKNGNVPTGAIAGVTLNSSTGTLTYANNYNFANSGDIKVKVAVMMGTTEYTSKVITCAIDEAISGTWTNPSSNSHTITDLSKAVNVLAGFSWKDYAGTNMAYWNVPQSGTASYVVNTTLLNLYGFSAPEIGFVNEDGSLTPMDAEGYLSYANGVVTCTNIAQDVELQQDYTATLRIKASTRWSENIAGFAAGYYDIKITIKAGSN